MGTIVRSGPSMCRKMVQNINPSTDLNIIELGAGDGVITRYILSRMAPEGKLFVFEINPELCETIKLIEDSRMILINDGAQNMTIHLKNNGLEHVDMIISALPFLVIPEDLTKEILQLCKSSLKSGGYFIQMHYIKSISKMYKNIFGNVQISYVPLNIPPGYVFSCKNENI